ncbi:MAG: hypothetical protein H0X26_00960 [Alphaproteobacteria bacterium]|nr:hypothetical protein [Alphaproteobacteria bacterium]
MSRLPQTMSVMPVVTTTNASPSHKEGRKRRKEKKRIDFKWKIGKSSCFSYKNNLA